MPELATATIIDPTKPGRFPIHISKHLLDSKDRPSKRRNVGIQREHYSPPTVFDLLILN